MRGSDRVGPVTAVLAAILLCAGLAGCDDPGGDAPCAYVTCSSRGYCEAVGGRPVCRCIEGYQAVDLECVPDGAPDADADADGSDETRPEADGTLENGEVPDGVPCASGWDCGVVQACRDGICQTSPCATDADCGPGESCMDAHCRSSGCLDDADCAAEESCDVHGCGSSEAGFCRFIAGGACPESWEPVCGCDGITYDNDCKRVLAGMGLLVAGECS